jgi:hypothetical protein
MASPVLAALAQSHLNETARREDDLAKQVYKIIGPPGVADPNVPAIFAQFCAQWKVPALPARPATIAAFVLQNQTLGAEALLSVLSEIAAAHITASFSDPTTQWQVNAVMAQLAKIEQPRSWTKEDRIEFSRLPVTVQAIVLRRESERDAALQRSLQLIADERKQLKAAAENVRETEQAKPEIKTEETTNAKNENAAAAA